MKKPPQLIARALLARVVMAASTATLVAILSGPVGPAVAAGAADAASTATKSKKAKKHPPKAPPARPPAAAAPDAKPPAAAQDAKPPAGTPSPTPAPAESKKAAAGPEPAPDRPAAAAAAPPGESKLLQLARAGAPDKKTQRSWKAKCSSCHGEDGKGQTEQGSKMGMGDMTAAAFWKDVNDDRLRKVVLEGFKRTKNGKEQEMKPFRDQLQPPEVDAILALALSFKK